MRISENQCRGRARRQTGADLLVIVVNKPDNVLLAGSGAPGVRGKRPERGGLGRGRRGEERGEERGGVEREVDELEEGVRS